MIINLEAININGGVFFIGISLILVLWLKPLGAFFILLSYFLYSSSYSALFHLYIAFFTICQSEAIAF
ncbi:MAG: hypothetical protein ACRCZO_07490 [Cetobacterium sp.]